MQCDRAAGLVGAYLDQELDAETRRAFAAHLRDCSACASRVSESVRTSSQLAALGREPMPVDLSARVQRRLSDADARGMTSQPRVAAYLRMRGWWRYAAAGLVLCVLTAGLTGSLTSRLLTQERMEGDVVAAHVRSLLQDSPTQVASSDTHTVKPWFSGRLDFAPNVKDLSAEGFPLVGARLDYLDGRRIAALVYRRRLHVVNVFLWPSRAAADRSPRAVVHRGYNIMTWTRSGMVYWAVSDLNMSELQELQAQL